MATKKRKIVIAAIIIVVLAVSIMAFLNRDIIHAIFSSEKVGIYEIMAMVESKTDSKKSISLIINGVEVPFPLPNGAVEFENAAYPASDGRKQYLVTTKDWLFYEVVKLPQNGFVCDQMGAWYSVSNEDNSIKVGIAASMFSNYFMRIEVTDIS